MKKEEDLVSSSFLILLKLLSIYFLITTWNLAAPIKSLGFVARLYTLYVIPLIVSVVLFANI